MFGEKRKTSTNHFNKREGNTDRFNRGEGNANTLFNKREAGTSYFKNLQNNLNQGSGVNDDTIDSTCKWHDSVDLLKCVLRGVE